MEQRPVDAVESQLRPIPQALFWAFSGCVWFCCLAETKRTFDKFCELLGQLLGKLSPAARNKIGILNSSGPLADVATCAVSAALLNVRLPTVKLTHDKDDESPITSDEISVLDETTPLLLKRFPIAVTIYVFKTRKGEVVLIDPPEEVTEHCTARVSVITDGECILAMQTRGLITNDRILSSIATLAEQRHRQIVGVVRPENDH
ncbi:hypothetical protein KIN20_011452 [Parelaphostrongylus tenuis]|uniref:Uncharacterized protein n=1 Tax=Parelaphostrongylus tenuis TaxID=148309 RepID=A0AAD5MS31_PARTN|nr:hypothetical protein KIN20_011452 [Parelaphostrongylus tenuis]